VVDDSGRGECPVSHMARERTPGGVCDVEDSAEMLQEQARSSCCEHGTMSAAEVKDEV